MIYKRILNAYICDKLGYALMYILLYQSHIFIIANWDCIIATAQWSFLLYNSEIIYMYMVIK